MKKLCVFAIAWIFSTGAAISQGAPVWRSEYLRAQSAGELNVCLAQVNYNNAWFSARLYGDRFNFLYGRDDFTLPYGTVLGIVAFSIDGQVYAVEASTFQKHSSDQLSTAQAMQLSPKEEDHAALFNALKFGSSFRIVFPNGDTYPISLRGSDRALSAASNCWARNQTGVHSNNPFGTPEVESSPFGSDGQDTESDL